MNGDQDQPDLAQTGEFEYIVGRNVWVEGETDHSVIHVQPPDPSAGDDEAAPVPLEGIIGPPSLPDCPELPAKPPA